LKPTSSVISGPTMVPFLVTQASIAEPRQLMRFMTLISPWPMISCSWRRKSAAPLMKKVVWPLSPKADCSTRSLPSFACAATSSSCS
jgi:hypothetical protein